MTIRKILHIDMDAFYASVEQLDRPKLRGRPLVVGGDPLSRGVVAAASYEARKFGIRSAMSCKKAQQLCPHVTFVRPRFHRYQEISEQIFELYREVTPFVEPLSLDEAYLDVTENSLNEPLGKNVAIYLRQRILDTVGLTASAGVGPNKFIAKIASDFKKPNGLVVVAPQNVLSFIEKLPVEKLWGVGPATTKVLHSMGLFTVEQIRTTSLVELQRTLGSFGEFLHQLSNGIDERPVVPVREAKSRGTEETFEKDVVDLDFLLKCIDDQAEVISQSLKEMESRARTVTLKVRYRDFKTITRSKTLGTFTEEARLFQETASKLLLEATDAGTIPVRLIGMSVSNFQNPEEPEQLWFDFVYGGR